jgi:hypothetical protein
MREVKIVMLKTGQFLIGKFQKIEDSITIEDPFEVMINPTADRDGNLVPQVGMFPFCLMSKDRTFGFNWSDIVTGPLEPDDQCKMHYVKSTSRIEIPTPEQARIITG